MTKLERAVLEFARLTRLVACDPSPENLMALLFVGSDLTGLALEQERQLFNAKAELRRLAEQ